MIMSEGNAAAQGGSNSGSDSESGSGSSSGNTAVLVLATNIRNGGG